MFAGLLVLLAAVVLLLGQTMETWLAALIVGAVVLMIGFVMLQSGKKKLDPSAFKPERTQDALRKDKDMVQRRAS
jgi:xanthine/uracil permease